MPDSYKPEVGIYAVIYTAEQTAKGSGGIFFFWSVQMKTDWLPGQRALIEQKLRGSRAPGGIRSLQSQDAGRDVRRQVYGLTR